ncbi:MAG: hypothetical protein ACRDND_27970 [Streptosporangiaceae bacterium]
MNHTPDTTAAGNDGTFGPPQAAALLDETTQQARRNLAPSPPWLLATRAVMVLATCGAVWLSVRGQHPYKGPTAAVIPVLVAFIVLNFVATVGVRRRQTTGVRGPSRLRPAEIAILTLAWVAVVVIMVALAAAGVSFSLYPTTVLIVPGLAWAAVMAARGNWRSFGTGAGVVAVGVVGAFAGPAGAWAVAGVGLCLVLLGTAAAVAWQRRA